MAKKIVVVDDERPIADILEFNLEKEGYEVHCAYDGNDALELILEVVPDIVLLDIMLPGMDGMEVCREVRKKHEMPIIMLTAKDSEIDKVLGLELGADDYVTKPFSTRELIARVKANLRRNQETAPKEKEVRPTIYRSRTSRYCRIPMRSKSTAGILNSLTVNLSCSIIWRNICHR